MNNRVMSEKSMKKFNQELKRIIFDDEEEEEETMSMRPNVTIEDYNALVEKTIRLELENKQRAVYIRELQDELIALKLQVEKK